MYEEENRTGFILKDILLQVFLVVIFVFILVWLFPTKKYVDNKIDSSLDPIYQEFFNTHLETMKEAGKSYFTKERLPKKVGDKVTLTLGDMLDKKLITSFVDSNQKQCNLTSSYIEVTKMDKEYTMKVNLSCSDKSDYILVNLGCYNYCDSVSENKESTNNSTTIKPTTTNKTYQYEYKLVTPAHYTDWSTWSKWSTKKVASNNYTQIDTKEVREVVSTTKVLVDKVNAKKEVVDSYNAGTETSIVCPTGYKRYDANSSTSKLCIASPNKGVSTNTLTSTTSSCPSGATLVNGRCTVQTTTNAVYNDWTYVGRQTFNGSKTTTDTMKYVYVSQSQELDCNNSCSVVVKVTYDVYKRGYTCPTGYTLSGTKCTKNTIVDAVQTTTSTTKLCPGNGDYDATMGWCYVRGTTETVCKGGVDGRISGNKCIVEKTDYVCDEGTLVGKKCYIYETEKEYDYVTYYRYRTREYIKEDTKTAWSTSKNDKNLLNKGYVLTGKKQEITKA